MNITAAADIFIVATMIAVQFPGLKMVRSEMEKAINIAQMQKRLNKY